MSCHSTRSSPNLAIRDRFSNDLSLRVHRALSWQHRDTRVILSTLFDRIYVLRNQLVHGGSTWNSSVSSDQVRDGANIVAALVPLFVGLMMDFPGTSWGSLYYPVVEVE